MSPSVPNPELPVQALVGNVLAREEQGVSLGCTLLVRRALVSVGTPLLNLTGLLWSVCARVACPPSPLEAGDTFLPCAASGVQKGFLMWGLAAG